MKKLLLPFLTIGLLSLFGACSSEDIPDAPRPDNTPQITNPGLDRALRIAEEMMQELDGGATRSSRRIATIEQINQLTRSDVQAPNWFLVNYDNESGFALVNDANIDCPVYGIANTGSLFMRDTVENKGLAIVLNKIFTMGHIQSLICSNDGNAAAQVDDWGGGYIPGQPITPTFPTDSLKQPWTPITPPVTTITGPFLTSYVQNWTQHAPFNELCPIVYDKDGQNPKKGLVGCCPLAVAMIMSHYQWPMSYYSASPNETYEFHWDEIRDYRYRYATSRLTRELSRAYNLDAHWEYDGTPVYNSQTYVPRTFENFGYVKPTFQDFAVNAGVTLTNGNPVYIEGSYTNANGEKGGHAWVIDGVMTIKANDAGDSPNTSKSYYHCVWGWSGLSNGYFYMYDSVDPGIPYEWEYEDFGVSPGDLYKDLKIIGRVYPVK